MRVKLKPTFRVNIIESEAGWGQKVDEIIYFDSEPEAKQYALDYNARYNTTKKVPSWYMRADYCGLVH